MSQTPPESAPPASEAAPTPSSEGAPGTDLAADSGGAPASDAADESAGDKGSNATTYAILGVVVVILAIVLAIQVPAIQIQLRLRKLQTGLSQPTPVVDEPALEALVAEGPGLLTYLADELEVGGPERERFRIFLVGRLLAPMEGEEATQVLIAMAADKSPAIRANVYDQLANRAQAKLMDPKLARDTLALCWAGDSDEISKGFAASSSVRLGDAQAVWPLIWSIRHMPARGSHLVPNFVESLKIALGPKVALDLKASPEEIQRQMLAIEAAYQAQGGKIPAGQDLKSELEKGSAPASGGAGQ